MAHSMNLAGVWAMQHDREIRALIARNSTAPAAWPA